MNEQKKTPSAKGVEVKIKLKDQIFTNYVSQIHQEAPSRNFLATYRQKIVKQTLKTVRTIRLRLKNVPRR
ncbi:hypothetical protein ACYSNU_17635 [Enterococcus sp. LJL120]